MIRTRIIGTGAYLPERTVGNREVAAKLGMDPEAVHRLTGIEERRWAAEHQASSDLAIEACRRALIAAETSPASIDAVIVSTTSPDMPFPSTACLVQRGLGCGAVGAFDVSASCSGFLYGLSIADAMIRSGLIACGLVTAAEVKSKSLDPSDEATALLFGDGAGAAVVRAESTVPGQERGILGVRVYADGAKHGLIGIAAGGSRTPSSRDTIVNGRHTLRMNGGPLFRTAVRSIEQAVRDLLKEFGVQVEDLAQAVFHQANGRILDRLGERLGLPRERMCSVIERYGNTSSASLPIALDAAVRARRIGAGDLVLLGAFGGGATWGAGVVRW